MKLTKSITLALTLSLSSPVYSYDTWECAVWLCLPVGFIGADCGKAKRAMVKRLFKGKSPMPSFDSCSVPGPDDSQYDYKRGIAILMDSGAVIEGGFCNLRETGPEKPKGCVATLNTVRVMQYGVQTGMTFYRNKNGQDLVGNPITGALYPADNVPAEALQGLY